MQHQRLLQTQDVTTAHFDCFERTEEIHTYRIDRRTVDAGFEPRPRCSTYVHSEPQQPFGRRWQTNVLSSVQYLPRYTYLCSTRYRSPAHLYKPELYCLESGITMGWIFIMKLRQPNLPILCIHGLCVIFPFIKHYMIYEKFQEL